MLVYPYYIDTSQSVLLIELATNIIMFTEQGTESTNGEGLLSSSYGCRYTLYLRDISQPAYWNWKIFLSFVEASEEG